MGERTGVPRHNDRRPAPPSREHPSELAAREHPSEPRSAVAHPRVRRRDYSAGTSFSFHDVSGPRDSATHHSNGAPGHVGRQLMLGKRPLTPIPHPSDGRAPGPSRHVSNRTGRAAASVSGYEPLCAPLVADGLGLGVGEAGVPPSSCWAASARARASRRRV